MDMKINGGILMAFFLYNKLNIISFHISEQFPTSLN